MAPPARTTPSDRLTWQCHCVEGHSSTVQMCCSWGDAMVAEGVGGNVWVVGSHTVLFTANTDSSSTPLPIIIIVTTAWANTTKCFRPRFVIINRTTSNQHVGGIVGKTSHLIYYYCYCWHDYMIYFVVYKDNDIVMTMSLLSLFKLVRDCIQLHEHVSVVMIVLSLRVLSLRALKVFSSCSFSALSAIAPCPRITFTNSVRYLLRQSSVK